MQLILVIDNGDGARFGLIQGAGVSKLLHCLVWAD